MVSGRWTRVGSRMESEPLLAKVRSSQSEVAHAKELVALLLREVGPTKRADKTTISMALQAALAQLRAAQRQLSLLERLASGKDDK